MTGILVTDFDGTMTRHDFYRLAIEFLLPSDVPNYWAKYRAQEISHFEALQSYFAEIRASESEVLALMHQMELDPDLATSIHSLQKAGWKVVITSAGCDWYIRRLLAGAGVDVEVLANPGQFEPGKGLLMQRPSDPAISSPDLGVDKSRVVRQYLREGKTVAFAGDGFPDVEPACLVADDLRYACGDLADVLKQKGMPFHEFAVWSDIAKHLLRKAQYV